ncbi:FYVE zinc finger-domain-containing protein [Polychytrium aggregatum]|uniref:FYVE zinc finger-domain-containing protein n=1 Tax=Polychytrium aggregatum TaxID=110093 RepID=UPI0022FEDFE7|nr:FYVE zinc finger-domain-containing protein [Polychytrium aggregatum]KAI9207659.1 FYVE zinc finger-domain-containing protein [Polychytrium aggregatum]
MQNLYQLNQHLDDMHNEDDTSAAIFSFLRKTKEKVINPLSKAARDATTSLSFDKMNILSNMDKLGLVSNPIELNPNSMASPSGSSGSQPQGSTGPAEIRDPEFGLKKTHWQRETGNDLCSTPGCGRALGLRFGKQNCRRCGKLFCDSHTSFQIRLALDARHDPEKGIWCRVCESCYTHREGYGDNNGVTRSHTHVFSQLRRERVQRVLLEVNKLENRFDKLTKLYVSEHRMVNKRSSISSMGGLLMTNNLRALEQDIVKWEDDGGVKACPFCSSTFGALNRRHHCRTCGRVVCGLDTCSAAIPVVDPDTKELAGELRTCNNCKRLVLRRKKPEEQTPPFVVVYQKIIKIRESIETILPRFQDVVMDLIERKNLTLKDRDYLVAVKYKKDITDLFSQMDALGKRIKSFAAESSTQQRIHSNIQLSCTQYIQSNMYTLNLLPKLQSDTKGKEPNVDSIPIQATAVKDIDRLRELRQQYDVLTEQRQLVQKFLEDAVKRRRLEDAQSLRENLRALDDEMARVKKEMEDS